MHPARLQLLLTELTTAAPDQILALEDRLRDIVTQQFTGMALARRARAISQLRQCPYCHAKRVVRHGKDHNQRQRFRCRDCRRTYNSLTGTPMARARKPEKWACYLGLMTDHHTIRGIRQSGIGLNHVTIWRWRHRFLQAAVSDQAEQLDGVIEVAETRVRHSCKGRRRGPAEAATASPAAPPDQSAAPPDQSAAPPDQSAGASPDQSAGASPDPSAGAPRAGRCKAWVRVLSAIDRAGGVVQAILGASNDIETVLRGRIAAGSVVCFEGSSAYARAAEQARAVAWRIVPDGIVPDGVSGNPLAAAGGPAGRLGLRRVRQHHAGLRHLLNERCRGVATKYLAAYLGWHRAMVRPGFAGQDLLLRALALPRRAAA